MKRMTILVVFLIACSSIAQVNIRDVSSVLDIYTPVSFVVENKIMELDENGNFRGGLLTTRFDIAQYIYRTIKNFQLDELSKKFSALEETQKEVSAKMSGIEAAYRTYDQRLRELETATVNLQSQLDKLSQELFAQVQKQLLDYIKSQENQLAKIDALTARLDAVEKLNSELFKQMQAQQSDLNNVLNEQVSIKNQILSLSQQLSALKSSVESLAKKLDQTSAELASLKDSTKNEFAAFTSLIDQKISSSENRLNVTLKSLQNELALQKKELTDRIEESNRLKLQIQDLQKRLTTLESFASKQQIQELKDQIDGLAEKTSKIEQELRNLESNLASLDLSRLQRRIEELEAKNKSLESNLNMAYIVGAAGIAIGLLAIILGLGGK
uniref:SLH domain-containing protein n=1 Tax=Pseudothermotoga hypogea TaxID=57487 RepID=A0A832IAP1_9THEM